MSCAEGDESAARALSGDPRSDIATAAAKRRFIIAIWRRTAGKILS
jgi:uncharacterized cupin superfamily protein